MSESQVIAIPTRVGLWRSWERASMAWKRSSVRSRPGPPSSNPQSRPNLDLGSVRYSFPDLVHFLIRNGDAAIRPVLQPVSGTDGTEAVGQSMDKNIASGRNATVSGIRP